MLAPQLGQGKPCGGLGRGVAAATLGEVVLIEAVSVPKAHRGSPSARPPIGLLPATDAGFKITA
jgi:hypothetical protein